MQGMEQKGRKSGWKYKKCGKSGWRCRESKWKLRLAVEMTQNSKGYEKFKGTEKSKQQKMSNIVKIQFYTFSVCIVDFEEVNTGWKG